MTAQWPRRIFGTVTRLQLGFSLLEAMIVMSIMSGSALVTAQMMQQSGKVQNTGQAKASFAQMVSWVNTVVANDSTCSSALNLTTPGSGTSVTYNVNYNPTKPIVYTGGPFLDSSGTIIAPSTSFPTTYSGGQAITLYSLGGTPYIQNYIKGSSTNSIFGNLKVLQTLLVISDPSASTGMAVPGSPNTSIFHAKLYISAMPMSSQILNPMKLYLDESVPINIQVTDVGGIKKITSCSGFRLGNSTTANIPVCSAGQVVFANGTSYSCVNVGCPAEWRLTSSPSDAGYVPPNTNLALVTNGGVNTSTTGYNTSQSGWFSGVGCTMCNQGQANIGTWSASSPTTSGTVICQNTGVCPAGWHQSQSSVEPGSTSPGINISLRANSNVNSTTGGYNYFSGWISSLSCAPGGGSAQSCTDSQLPWCPSTIRAAPFCSYVLPAAGGGPYCTYPCPGSATSSSPCKINYNNVTNNHTTPDCTNVGGYVDSSTYLCRFIGQAACPGGWTGAKTTWVGNSCTGGSISPANGTDNMWCAECCATCGGQNTGGITSSSGAGFCHAGSTSILRCQAYANSVTPSSMYIPNSVKDYNTGATCYKYWTSCHPTMDHQYCWNGLNVLVVQCSNRK